MLFSRKPSTKENWETILTRLQALRGQGLWRGNLVQLRPEDELRIPLEFKDDSPEKHYAIIFIKAKAEEIYAGFTFREGFSYLRDFELNVDNFLQEILREVRQRTYIRTNKDKANYRSRNSFS